MEGLANMNVDFQELDYISKNKPLIMTTTYEKRKRFRSGIIQVKTVRQTDKLCLDCHRTVFFKELENSKIVKDCFAEHSYYGLVQFVKGYCEKKKVKHISNNIVSGFFYSDRCISRE